MSDNLIDIQRELNELQETFDETRKQRIAVCDKLAELIQRAYIIAENSKDAELQEDLLNRAKNIEDLRQKMNKEI